MDRGAWWSVVHGVTKSQTGLKQLGSGLNIDVVAAGAGARGTFLLRVAFRHVICGPYLISPPG